MFNLKCNKLKNNDIISNIIINIINVENMVMLNIYFNYQRKIKKI